MLILAPLIYVIGIQEYTGAEAILGLRGLWLDQDDRWRRYWNSRPAYKRAA